MEEVPGLAQTLGSAASNIAARVVDYLPNVLGAVLLLLIGWLLARVLRALTRRAVQGLERLLPRLGPAAQLGRTGIARAPALLGAVVFWVVILFFVTAATHLLGLETFRLWLARLTDYLPTLAAGALIVAAGYVLSRFVAELVLATATALAPAQRNVLARLAQVLILIGAVLVGADQIGIKVTFLVIFAATLAAAVVGGVALAVGLGARDYIANLIGAHHLQGAFTVGQTIRVAGHEGRILEVTATALVLETDEGRVVLPGRVYGEQPIALITGRNDA
jgi:small-conductance mechanosensitive channel